ncbi:MAG: hypothetical protein IT342_26805 [Candidatus Melainabacteria bacterium]|nr:hypothetical protein [Candidatus Melainabacteria bacterium]
MSEYFQPVEDNGEVLSKIILLLLGIFIGTAVTATFCYFSGMGGRGPHITVVDGGAGAANAMESLPNSGPVQAPQPEPAYAQEAMQPTMPQQAAPGMMQAPPVNYIQTGTPLMMPDQMPQTQVYTQAQPTTLYAGQMMDDQAHAIGRNGLRANPCVDPPSCRGRAYSQALQ